MFYAYRPIAFFNGKILKCAGIIDDSNEHIIKEKSEVTQDGLLPGYIVLDGHRGDRIHACNFRVYIDGDEIK